MFLNNFIEYFRKKKNDFFRKIVSKQITFVYLLFIKISKYSLNISQISFLAVKVVFGANNCKSTAIVWTHPLIFSHCLIDYFLIFLTNLSPLDHALKIFSWTHYCKLTSKGNNFFVGQFCFLKKTIILAVQFDFNSGFFKKTISSVHSKISLLKWKNKKYFNDFFKYYYKYINHNMIKLLL